MDEPIWVDCIDGHVLGVAEQHVVDVSVVLHEVASSCKGDLPELIQTVVETHEC